MDEHATGPHQLQAEDAGLRRVAGPENELSRSLSRLIHPSCSNCPRRIWPSCGRRGLDRGKRAARPTAWRK